MKCHFECEKKFNISTFIVLSFFNPAVGWFVFYLNSACTIILIFSNNFLFVIDIFPKYMYHKYLEPSFDYLSTIRPSLKTYHIVRYLWYIYFGTISITKPLLNQHSSHRRIGEVAAIFVYVYLVLHLSSVTIHSIQFKIDWIRDREMNKCSTNDYHFNVCVHEKKERAKIDRAKCGIVKWNGVIKRRNVANVRCKKYC